MAGSHHCVVTPIVVNVHTQPSSLNITHTAVLSKRCVVKHVSSIAGSGMDECSHVSVMNRTQQSLVKLSQAAWRLSSSILLVRDLTFARERLGSGGLCGRFSNLASPPALHPRFCCAPCAASASLLIS